MFFFPRNSDIPCRQSGELTLITGQTAGRPRDEWIVRVPDAIPGNGLTLLSRLWQSGSADETQTYPPLLPVWGMESSALPSVNLNVQHVQGSAARLWDPGSAAALENEPNATEGGMPAGDSRHDTKLHSVTITEARWLLATDDYEFSQSPCG